MTFINNEVPNAETVEAIAEIRKMQTDLKLGRTYTDVNRMMEELLADDLQPSRLEIKDRQKD